jgi:endonuclease YncB( thermonuclease family)
MTAPHGYRYLYPAQLDRMVDADTLRVIIDHGCRVYSKQIIRLAGVNCPEMNTPEGKTAAALVTAMVSDHPMVVQTLFDRADPYGRFLGIVFIEDGGPGLLNLNRHLLDEHLADGSGPYAAIVAAMPERQIIEQIKAIPQP